MDYEELLSLAEQEGGYQPLLVKDEYISEGWRECAERYAAIKPYLVDNQTIVDIGSHYGYFSIRAAQDFDSFVWSIEGNVRRAAIQRRLLEANELPNVILSEHMLTLGDVTDLQSTCFMADILLVLSVAHYFPAEELREMLLGFSNLAPVLIIEFPSKLEREVASRDNVHAVDIEVLLRLAYRHVQQIGAGTSPKHEDVVRPIYRCSNPRIRRESCKSYVGNPTAREHLVEYGDFYGEKAWTIDGQPRRFTGLTLENLRHFGSIYPAPEALLRMAAEHYDYEIQSRHGAVTDINIRNVLYSHDNLHVIDMTEGLGETVYGLSWDDYVQRTLARDVDYHYDEFRQMWDGSWSP